MDAGAVIHGRAKDADKFLMSQQPVLKYTWNTMVTSSFWDMRLSIACAATDAEFQNRIILHDNLPVVAQQPHPDPNYAPHAAAHLLAVVLRCIAEGVATRDGVCAYDSFFTSKFLKTRGLLCMREDRLAASGTRSS